MNKELLQSLGWKVLLIWECELTKKNFEKTMNHIVQEIRSVTEN
jgi:G:T-mismatch repair DNA endonuclease (very short patch repair protein)